MTDKVFDLQANLRREYEAVIKTDFWKSLIERISRRHEIYLQDLKSVGADRFQKAQGRVDALEFVLAQPAKIIKGEKED